MSKRMERSPERPNIILITINVLRADHLGSYGYHRDTTPAIDSIAEDSFVFKNAFTQVGYTMPNMMTILTGVYPHSHQVYDAFKDELPSKVKTLAEVLQIYDYKTSWFALLDLGHLALRSGFGRGFEDKTTLGFQMEGRKKITKWLKKNRKEPFFMAMNVRHTHYPYSPLSKYRNAFKKKEEKLPFENLDDYHEAVYNRFIELVDVPGSVVYNLIDPETRKKRRKVFNGKYSSWKLEEIDALIHPKESYKLARLREDIFLEKVDLTDPKNLEITIALYDACILGIDQEIIKPLLKTLKKHQIYDDTMIIVTGDHGESLGEHGIVGHGLTYYDQFVHVPLIIKMPGSKMLRKNILPMVGSVDLVPTILDTAKIEKPHNLQGKSILPIMQGQSIPEEEEMVFGENRHFAYIRSSNWKLIVLRDQLAMDFGHEDLLFDLAQDPQELVDVKKMESEKYNQLRKLIKQHLEKLPVYVEKEYQFWDQIEDATREKIKETGYW